jgi:protein-tyrosine phosphatase
VPVLDGCAPNATDYETAFAFVGELRDSALYICCANGHGRSVTFACALLMKLGIAATAEDAVTMITERRQRASLNREQLRSLQRCAVRDHRPPG